MRAVAEHIVAFLQEKGFEAYFAGGCVRDQLLGLTPKDYDVATNARPEEVEALFPGQSDLVGKSFGVVIVREGGVTVDVATFRNDGIYRDGRHPESITFCDAEEDARRRDFTINALFFDPIKKEVKDFIEGQKDLGKKIIRAVGNPSQRFAEDKLRMLRAIRFAAQLDFQIESQTWQALKQEAASIVQVSPERIRDELTKSLVSPHPVKGLDLLEESGLLQILLPEITAMKEVEQPPQFHPEGDVYKHVRLMLSQLKQPSADLAWAVLLHDVGKPATQSVDPNGRIRFNAHETVGANLARKILTRLRFSNAQTDRICQMVANHMSFKDVPQMRLSTLKRLMARDTFIEELELHRVDCLSSHGSLDIHQKLQQEREKFTVEEIKPKCFLNGQDVLARGMAPGPQVGDLLKAVYDLQLDGKVKNRDEALEWMDKKLKQLDFKKNPEKPFLKLPFFGIVFLILGMVLLFDWCELGKLWDEKQWDKLQALASPKTITLTNAVIVKIDESTLATHGEGKWPLSPLSYATLLQSLRGNGIRGVGIEVVLTQHGEKSIFDSALTSQLRRTPNVVLAGSALTIEGPLLQDYSANPLSIKSKNIDLMPDHKGVLLPEKAFATDTSLGFNNLPALGDGVVRTIPLAFRFGTNLYPSFLLQSVLQNEKLDVSAVKWEGDHCLTIETKGVALFSIPVDRNCNMRLKIPETRHFESVGLDNLVLSASLTNEHVNSTAWSMDKVQSQFVFVGRTDKKIYDPLLTSAGFMSPIEFQALGWQAIYARQVIGQLSVWLKILMGTSVFAFMLWFSLKYGMPWPLFAWCFLVVDLYCLNIFLISIFHLWIPPTSFLFGLSLCFLTGTGWRWSRVRWKTFSAESS